MRGFVVISDRILEQQELQNLYNHIGRTDLISPDRLVVEGEWGHFFFTANASLREAFDDEELTRIRGNVYDLHFYSVDFSTLLAANKAVTCLPSAAMILIDNDHGLIASIKEVRRRIGAGIDWTEMSR
jgi:hypothetical protein